VRANHEGRLNIRNSFFGGFGNNSIYGSTPGKRGSEGPVIIENCFSHSSTTGSFRTGTPGSRVRDSLVVVNDPNCDRGPYPGDGSYTARPVWASHYPDQRAENVHVIVSPDDCNMGPGAFQTRWCSGCGNGSGGSTAELTLQGCHINQASLDAGYDAFYYWDGTNRAQFRGQTDAGDLGRSPSPNVLGYGVPLSAEAAGRGDLSIPDVDVPGIPSPDPNPDPEPPDEPVQSGFDGLSLLVAFGLVGASWRYRDEIKNRLGNEGWA
jgi:hypothetical protein